MSISITAHIEYRYAKMQRWQHLATAPIAPNRSFAAQLEIYATPALPQDVCDEIDDIASHLSSVDVYWSYAPYEDLWTKAPVDLMFLLFYAKHTLESMPEDDLEIRVVFEIC